MTGDLERKYEEYRALDETSDSIPFRMTPDLTRFIYVGPQAQRLLGIAQPAWLVPGFFEERLAVDDRAATFEQFRVVLEFGASHEVEFRMRRDDNAWIWLRCTMRSFDAADGTVLAGHLQDITVRRFLASDLAQFQRLEAVGRLASGIAHEINTPLQFVGHSAEFLREAFSELLAVVRTGGGTFDADEIDALETDVTEAITRCSDGLERVGLLVRSMRTFSHPAGKQKSAVDLHDIIRSAIAISAGEHKPVAVIATELGELPPICCFASELGQVFLNLIVNAAHTIEEAIRGSEARGTITITTYVAGDQAVIEIRDTGCGIAEDVRERVFEPFFTTKEVGRGTGQGLAISRDVIERHAGTLTFVSELDRGTTFTVRLPL